MKSFYLTTAIDYANGSPHLGHAYEKVLSGESLVRADFVAPPSSSLRAWTNMVKKYSKGPKVRESSQSSDAIV